VPPVPTEEQVGKKGVEEVKVEDAKRNDDGDVMDVVKTSAQLPLKETTTHANEHLPGKPTPASTDRMGAEDDPHAPHVH